DFLDTLGIGSFATTTTLYRPFGVVADENLPGTLNVGHILPTVTQALIYVSVIEVDPTTLVAMIAASVLGAWLGAGVVTRLPRRPLRRPGGAGSDAGRRAGGAGGGADHQGTAAGLRQVGRGGDRGGHGPVDAVVGGAAARRGGAARRRATRQGITRRDHVAGE